MNGRMNWDTTAQLAIARWRWSIAVALQRFGGGEHGLGMARHFHLAPFLAQYAGRIDQKRTALDADELATVHALFLDDVEQGAQLLLLVRQQLERKLVFGFEFLVRRDAVGGDAEN